MSKINRGRQNSVDGILEFHDDRVTRNAIRANFSTPQGVSLSVNLAAVIATSTSPFSGSSSAAKKRKDAKGVGHRKQSPNRLRGLELARGPLGKALIEGRRGIERFFGNATSFGGGLGQLPAWVRTPERLTAWVGCKLLIDAARRERKQRLAA